MSETQFLIGRNGLDLEDDFYPDDLPKEWYFDYYSTLFKALCLPIDTDEDLEQIFEELADTDEEFELVLSIKQADLADADRLVALLETVSSYQTDFTLWAQIDKAPSAKIIKILSDYQFCLQSDKVLDLDLKHKTLPDKTVYFSHFPVVYSATVWNEEQMKLYLQSMANINTKTVLICQFADSETLHKIRIVAELLGF